MGKLRGMTAWALLDLEPREMLVGAAIIPSGPRFPFSRNRHKRA